MTPEEIAEIEARTNAATPGPWWAWDRGVGYHIATGEPDERGFPRELLPEGFRTDIGDRLDAEFIAHAREDVPALLAEVKRLQAKVTERGEAVAKYQQACGDHQRNLFAAREDVQAVLAKLANTEGDRDRARDAAVALTDDLAEIKTLAYMGGQDAETVRRAILGVFERRSR